MARTRTDERVATADDRVSESRIQPATVTHDDVASRAYDIYVERGWEDGHDVDDWLQAERELLVTFAAV